MYLYAYMSLCIDMCVLVHVYVHSVAVRGQSWMSSLVTLHMIFEAESFTELGGHNQARLASQQAPVTSYFHRLSGWDYEHA